MSSHRKHSCMKAGCLYLICIYLSSSKFISPPSRPTIHSKPSRPPPLFLDPLNLSHLITPIPNFPSSPTFRISHLGLSIPQPISPSLLPEKSVKKSTITTVSFCFLLLSHTISCQSTKTSMISFRSALSFFLIGRQKEKKKKKKRIESGCVGWFK